MPSGDTTLRLLTRAQKGDGDAVDALFSRHVPALGLWARRRLPRWARDIADTQDLVQETILQTIKNLRSIEYRGKGSLQAYLRHALLNRVRNELRRASRHPAAEAIDEGLVATQTSPLDSAIRREQFERYESAMAQLSKSEQELIVARLELGLTYEEMADALGKPSWNAVRMATARALLRLGEELRLGQQRPADRDRGGDR
jgi:RNA polymerase sigma-70 factor, ECF subfamily